MATYKLDTTANLTQWWQQPLAECVLAEERAYLQTITQYFHGYYQLQFGTEKRLFPELDKPKMQTLLAETGDVSGHSQALPFKSHSLDTVLLIHLLEFADDPHQALREAERVLVADGILIIACFNPWSLWGLQRLFSRRKKMPWRGHFFGQERIKDWLSLLNFDVVETESLVFRPPFKSEKWLNRTHRMETWGRKFWPIFSGVNILVASKRTIPLTPVAESWRSRQFFPKVRLLTKPATREKING